MTTCKGDKGRIIDRDPEICAAGVPSALNHATVADALQHYLLKDEVNALISDAIIPPPPPRQPPLKKPPSCDSRCAGFFTYGEITDILHPPIPSKWEQLAADLKETTYKSYWNKVVGHRQPLGLPDGLNANETTFGTKNVYVNEPPIVPLPEIAPHKQPAYQTRRNYCQPAFKPDATYGVRTNADKRGNLMKCCLTDDEVIDGKANCLTNSRQFDFLGRPPIGYALTPNNNINEVPVGHTFGKRVEVKEDSAKDCMTQSKLNPERELYKKCLGHLNALRKVISKHNLQPSFFKTFYLKLKYYDSDKSGWLPKDVVYNYCQASYIIFSPPLIEPLLKMWHAFDGERINYKIFVNLLNFKEPFPELDKIPDMDVACAEYRTTYGEMTKSGRMSPGGDNKSTAGVPSGRYFDRDMPVDCILGKDCIYEETDAKSCLYPSIFTQLNVSHRDMYAKREPEVVRRVFEAAGEDFTDERFMSIWENAKRYHSQGWVSFETFRKALKENIECKAGNP